jgi:hypothetical protein
MNLLQEEIFKLVKRRSSLIFLLITVVGFPVFAISISYLESHGESVIEGFFLEKAAQFILIMTVGPFMIIGSTFFTAQELTNGFVNRVVMITSRERYFLSKVYFTTSIAILLAILGSFSLYLSVTTSGLNSVKLDLVFATHFLIQLLLFALLYSFIYLNLTFMFRSPLAAGLAAYFFPQIDHIIYIVVKMWLNLDLWWLPFRSLGSLFQQINTDGSKREEYVDLFTLSPLTIAWPILFVMAFTYLNYRWFLRRDLKILSD